MRRTVLILALTSISHAQEPLAVPGFGEASIVVPQRQGPMPVVVALHGNFDRPDWVCAVWAQVVDDRAFVLCPRGLPRHDSPPGDPRWTHRQRRDLVREVAAARSALAARYPGRVDDGPDIWVGFSLGAHRVASLALREPDRYPLIQLVEGGDDMWAASRPRYGGRVALVCGQRGCERQGNLLIERLPRDHARLERIEACHSCIDVMLPAVRRTFDWLIAADRRFAHEAGG
jgi:hypothetical protein